jgi:hypothetical protein
MARRKSGNLYIREHELKLLKTFTNLQLVMLSTFY